MIDCLYYQPVRPQEARSLAEQLGGPLRAPHYTASLRALLPAWALEPPERDGNARPGELDLAAGGVLYLDQLEAWPLDTLHALAACVGVDEPDGRPVTLRAGWTACPCGMSGRFCVCNDEAIRHYLAGLSLRIDAIGGLPHQRRDGARLTLPDTAWSLVSGAELRHIERAMRDAQTLDDASARACIAASELGRADLHGELRAAFCVPADPLPF